MAAVYQLTAADEKRASKLFALKRRYHSGGNGAEDVVEAALLAQAHLLADTLARLEDKLASIDAQLGDIVAGLDSIGADIRTAG